MEISKENFYIDTALVYWKGNTEPSFILAFLYISLLLPCV